MFFRQVIGQEALKEKLCREQAEGRIAHGQLFAGAAGFGGLPLALAYARFLLCPNPSGKEACGHCPSCRKVDDLAHPDLHFVFPVVKRKNVQTNSTFCDDYLPAWRELIAEREGYFDLNHWLEKMGAENQQAVIYTIESHRILQKLSLKSSEGGYKIMVIWLPEKMMIECANKLLKILEEPPAQTLFLFVSEQPDQLLPTICSRLQQVPLKRIEANEVISALQVREGLQEERAREVAHQADGDYLRALETIHTSHDAALFLDLFITLMRMSYQRKIKEMKQWSDRVAAMGREKQKHFLEYCQRLIRENFIYNFGQQDLNYMIAQEQSFSERFAPFVNEQNIIPIMEELAAAQRDIEQNTNPRMVFFDLSLKMIVMLIQKPAK